MAEEVKTFQYIHNRQSRLNAGIESISQYIFDEEKNWHNAPILYSIKNLRDRNLILDNSLPLLVESCSDERLHKFLINFASESRLKVDDPYIDPDFLPTDGFIADKNPKYRKAVITIGLVLDLAKNKGEFSPSHENMGFLESTIAGLRLSSYYNHIYKLYMKEYEKERNFEMVAGLDRSMGRFPMNDRNLVGVITSLAKSNFGKSRSKKSVRKSRKTSRKKSVRKSRKKSKKIP